MALLISLVEGALYTCAFLIWRQDVRITLADGILAASSCILGITGYLCFFESIMKGQVAIAGTISAAYPVLTVIGAFLVLSETLTLIQAVGVVAIIGGVIALSYEPDPGSKHALDKRSLLFAFLAFGFWGIWSLTSKMAVDRITAGNLFAFYILSSLTAPLLYGWFRRMRPIEKSLQVPTRTTWAFGALALALNVFGAFAYTYALQGGTASLVVPISSAYPIVTVVLAIGLLREKINRLHALSLGVVVVGLVLIGLTL